MSKKRKRELGQDRPITRRDFIHGSTAMLGAALASSSCDAPAPEESGATDYAFDVGEAWYGPGASVTTRRHTATRLNCCGSRIKYEKAPSINARSMSWKLAKATTSWSSSAQLRSHEPAVTSK